MRCYSTQWSTEIRKDSLKRLRRTVSLYQCLLYPNPEQHSTKGASFSPQFSHAGRREQSEHPTSSASEMLLERPTCASPRGLKELAWLNCRGEGGSYKHRKGWGSQLLVQGSQQLACDSLAEDLPVHGSWHQPRPPCTLAPELSTHGPLHLTCPLIVPGIEPVWTPPARPPAFFSNHPTRTD